MAAEKVNEEFAFCDECELELPLSDFSHYDPETENVCDGCRDDIGEELEDESEEFDEDEELEFEEG